MYQTLTIKKKENENEIDPDRLIRVVYDDDMEGFGLGDGECWMTVRSAKAFNGKAIYLPDRYAYVIGNDGINDILVPLKK